MDLNEIRNTDLSGKSKAEIVEFLTRAMSELELGSEYEILKEMLPPEMFAQIEKAVEKDTIEFADDYDEEVSEEELAEWLEEDKVNRPFLFTKNEKGQIVIKDVGARMSDDAIAGVINPEDLDLARLVELVRTGIDYNRTHAGYGALNKNAYEMDALESSLKSFSEQVRDIKSIKDRADQGDKSPNMLMEVFRLTKIGLTTNDLAPLVNTNAASIVSMLRMAEANQRFKYDDEVISREEVDELRQGYTDRPVYFTYVDNRQMFELIPTSNTLPRLDFDDEKIATQEFSDKLMEVLDRSKDRIGDRSTGFIMEELSYIVGKTLEGKSQDKAIDETVLRKAAEKFAKEPEVILETEMVDKVQSDLLQEAQRETEENGLDL